MPARKSLPDQDHVSRHVPYKAQYREPVTDVFLGVTAAAFELRSEDKGGLSLTWVEHFGAWSQDAKQSAAIAYRASQKSKKIGAKSAFVTATVSAVKLAASGYKKKVRIVHAPVSGNAGHSEARRFTDDDLELLELLATEVFTDVDLVVNMDLPNT